MSVPIAKHAGRCDCPGEYLDGIGDDAGNWELEACARQQIESYGDEAVVAAAMRARALLADGDLNGQRTWLAILQRIDQVTSEGADKVQH